MYVDKTTQEEVSVYKKGTIKNGWVNLKTDLKKGDEITIIFKNGHRELLEILDIKENKFQVFTLHQGDIFVYADQINKAKNIHPDIILSSNTTQQLEQEVEKLKAKNAQLKATVQQLQTQISNYKTKDK